MKYSPNYRQCHLVFAFLLLTAAGCGPQSAVVTGKVTYQGQPVHGGSLVFSSDEGQPAAAAEIQQDGSFSLVSSAGDVAQVGRYKVSYAEPPTKFTEEQKKDKKYVPPPSEYSGLMVKNATVEIKAGPNNVTIELIPRN